MLSISRAQKPFWVVALSAASVLVHSTVGSGVFTVTCSKDCPGRQSSPDSCNVVCSGEATQLSTCDVPQCPVDSKCKDQPPVDCKLTTWSDWAVDGCTGLAYKHRDVEVVNSCGGSPCSGTLSVTRKIDKELMATMGDSASCNMAFPTDCVFGDWQEWSNCGDFGTNTMSRKRNISQPAFAGGLDCEGEVNETRACGDEASSDCQVSEWLPWSVCHGGCGGGQKTRQRVVIKEAKHGGALCDTHLTESVGCGDGNLCDDEKKTKSDCTLSEWSEWCSCVTPPYGQQNRKRLVVTPARAGGFACTDRLEETRPCNATDMVIPIDCLFDKWSSWVLCDKSCGGGQTYRERSIKQEAALGGKACDGNLKEVQECNSVPCAGWTLEHNCHVSMWSSWSSCDLNGNTCGTGQKTRSREILENVKAGGYGCILPLAEAESCKSRRACIMTDCKWGKWSEWGSCSKSCGNGVHVRHRGIDGLPTQGGKECSPNDMSEMKSCNNFTCDVCVDGRWGHWNEWTSCSHTCDEGIRFRHRQVQKEASECGTPAIGDSQEVEKCEKKPCESKDDCKLGHWSHWSTCSNSCEGITKRGRKIVQHGSRKGKYCGDDEDGSLEEIKACGSKSCVADIEEADKSVDCVLGHWSSWSQCSMPCIGGQQYRSREVKIPPQGNGKSCLSSMVVTAPCNVGKLCGNEKNCSWGEWGEWGKCSKCGGQKTRHRRIATLPSDSSAPCDVADAEETTGCPRCKLTVGYCVWQEWSPYSLCSSSCDSGTQERTRSLQFMLTAPESYASKANDEKGCAGDEKSVQVCVEAECKCVPKDCRFSEWNEWAEPKSCAHYSGICRRNRTVASVENQCGAACTGDLEQTKACLNPKCVTQTQDCELSSWSKWSRCEVKSDQKFHTRTFAQNATEDGEACVGVLNDTQPCFGPKTVDCTLSEWTAWADCSKNCAKGYTTRTRKVVNEAKAGGLPCMGFYITDAAALEEMKECEDTLNCERTDFIIDCVFSPWGAWTGCTGDADEQGTRERHIKTSAQGDGEACVGSTLESMPCKMLEFGSGTLDCQMTSWDEWSPCFQTVQTFRSRNIWQFPQASGKACSGTTVETVPCSSMSKGKHDCTFHPWNDWTACVPECGQGHRSRTREIKTPASGGGAFCNASLTEVATCDDRACSNKTDCVWGPWLDWGDCLRAEGFCGVGSKSRNRYVVQLPTFGGQMCAPKVLKQVAPANCAGQSECCLDGQWASWSEWSECSATCYGTRFRSRTLDKKETWCGLPAEGSSMDYEPCETKACMTNLDCLFGSWSAFSPKSCAEVGTCGGARISHRTIKRNATGGGKGCEGEMTKSVACPRDPANPLCNGIGLGCRVSPWSDWSECSNTCDKGVITRERTVVSPPVEGGEACPELLKVAKACETGVECVDGRTDCAWEQWGEWSTCSNATDSKTRVRGIATPASHGGFDCVGENSESESCGRCSKALYSCSWQEWGEWSKCSASCGPGAVRERSRELKAGAQMAEVSSDVAREYLRIPGADQVSSRLSQRRLDILVGFFFGAIIFAVLVGIMVSGRFLTRRKRRLSNSGFLYAPAPELESHGIE